MPKNQRYKFSPCGYCGTITGQNHGEHVLPACMYPSTTPTDLRRLKIPSCPTCNFGWSDDEAHFQKVIAAAGIDPSPERSELWERAKEAFRRGAHGRAQAKALFETLHPMPI